MRHLSEQSHMYGSQHAHMHKPLTSTDTKTEARKLSADRQPAVAAQLVRPK